MLNRMGVPASILNGRNKKYARVYNLYKARLTQELMTIINQSYWTRAKGKDFEGAAHWRALSGNTVRAKAAMEPLYEVGILRNWYDREQADYVEKAVHRKRTYTPGQLSPKDQIAFNALTKQIADNDPNQGAGKLARARKQAWDMYRGSERKFATLINIRTGRLVAATAPGTVVNNRYYPPTDQLVRITYRGVYVSLRAVEYANEVDIQREIIPPDLSVWKQEAHDKVIGEVAAYYFALQEALPPDRKKKRKKRKKKTYTDDVPF